MGIYGKYLLPRLTKWSMSCKTLRPERAKCLAGARGRVLEVGFGNGLNLGHYPPEVCIDRGHGSHPYGDIGNTFSLA